MAADLTQQQRLQDLQRELDAALERERVALEASRLKSEFLASMSHEIRTPLNGIVGMLDVLLQTEMSPMQRDYVETLTQSADALMALLNDVLDFSKIEAGKLELDLHAFDLSKLIEDSAKIYQVAAARKNLELKIAITPAIRGVRVVGDQLRIRQVLFNLLQNAIKFTSQGHIEIRLVSLPSAKGTSTVRIEVEDTGIGIEPGVQRAIFSAFQQADQSTARKFGGTGLGLTICRNLIELMQGEIGVDSVPGVGSLFWFQLTMDNDSSAVSTDQIRSATSPTPRRAKARILVAEDDLSNQRVIMHLLNQQGHDAVLAVTGQDVLRKIAGEPSSSRPFDLILMDCHMPEMDGFKAAKALRDLGVKIPIVALTADVLSDVRERCRTSGMNGYLSKPFERERLQQMISDLLLYGRAPEFEASLILDQAKDHKATRAERQVLNIQALRMLDRLNEPHLSDLTVEIANTFMRDAPVRLANIRAALKRNDSEAVQLEAHSLKSVAALLGAEVLRDICADLEKKVFQRKPEHVLSRLPVLEKAYREVETMLLSLFPRSIL